MANVNRLTAGVASVIAAALIAGGASSAAWAGYFSFSDMGATVTVSGNTIILRDSADDGYFVSSNYKFDGGVSERGIANKLGYGQTVTGTAPSAITAARACHSRWLAPMACGAWRY